MLYYITRVVHSSSENHNVLLTPALLCHKDKAQRSKGPKARRGYKRAGVSNIMNLEYTTLDVTSNDWV